MGLPPRRTSAPAGRPAGALSDDTFQQARVHSARSVTAPREAELTVLAYLANTPRV